MGEECPYGKDLKGYRNPIGVTNNWEEATQNVVTEASKTLRNIRSVYIKEFTATVENDKISNYRVTAKVTFEMERS